MGRSWVLGATLASAIAVSMLLVLALPSVAGAVPTKVVVLSAPYHGTSVSPSSSVSTSACAKTTVTTSPWFSGRSGDGGLGGKTIAPICPRIGSSVYGSVDLGVSVSVPLPSSSVHSSVVAVTTIAAAGVAHVHPGTCASSTASFYSCYQDAYSSVSAYAYLIDMTAGLYYPSTTYWTGATASAYADVYCYGIGNPYNITPGCSSLTAHSAHYAFNSTFAWTFNATGANAADSFVLQFSVNALASADSYVSGTTLTGGSTWAVADVGTSGNGIQLDSVTIV